MNRRQYLTRMAASAAGLAISAACKNGSQQTVQGRTPIQTSMSTPEAGRASLAPPAVCSRAFKDWPTQNTKPSRCASVTLIFEGLMGFFYENDPEKGPDGQVAIHPGKGNHKFEISDWERPSAGSCAQADCNDKKFPPLDKKVRHIYVKVNGQPANVDYYKPGDCFDRINSNDYMDFRWLIDLEEWYPPRHDRRKHFKPLLHIQNGTFYTRMVTNAIFQRVDTNYKLSEQVGTIIGHVAHVMAVAIPLNSGQSVSIEQRDQDNKPLGNPYPIEPAPGTVRELQFRSHCPKGHEDCPDPEPCRDDKKEEKRNDFHFMRKVLDLPGGLPKYSIALALNDHDPAPTPAICSSVGLTERKDGDYCGADEHRVTDEAPCAGAGYGGGRCGC